MFICMIMKCECVCVRAWVWVCVCARTLIRQHIDIYTLSHVHLIHKQTNICIQTKDNTYLHARMHTYGHTYSTAVRAVHRKIPDLGSIQINTCVYGIATSEVISHSKANHSLTRRLPNSLSLSQTYTHTHTTSCILIYRQPHIVNISPQSWTMAVSTFTVHPQAIRIIITSTTVTRIFGVLVAGPWPFRVVPDTSLIRSTLTQH